ncbi:TetR/AcrR family transcriptional regulator [Thaumasiovibrio subtropicus]|uniref:TetR/AcrR family transcriptional regulator n=1 Tax=Thaumasiovibrio subtropicus TaxID=1891207 RepID=UPI000B34CEB7|nr:TetR/AcrR family transcriptional regulator [Thaumasiovibrio subtropicus]
METLIKKTRTRLSPEKRKQQLLDYALEVFARRGIGRAGHADIADMANVSVATVFNYFPTREELVEQVLAQVEQKFDDILTQCLSLADQSLRGSMECLTHRLVDAVLEEKEWLKVWFEWSTSVRDEVWPRYIASNNRTMERMTEAFKPAAAQLNLNNVEDTARLLHGVCYVLYLQANLTKDREALQAQANSYLDILCPAQAEKSE